jgi:hypothetical protein
VRSDAEIELLHQLVLVELGGGAAGEGDLAVDDDVAAVGERLAWIARRRGQPTDHDYELTDWEALRRFVDELLAARQPGGVAA